MYLPSATSYVLAECMMCILDDSLYTLGVKVYSTSRGVLYVSYLYNPKYILTVLNVYILSVLKVC